MDSELQAPQGINCAWGKSKAAEVDFEAAKSIRTNEELSNESFWNSCLTSNLKGTYRKELKNFDVSSCCCITHGFNEF